MFVFITQNGTGTIGGGHGHYTLHQAKGDASLGNVKSGYLNKRSEGRLRNIWQKRRCQVQEDGVLNIFHADESKPPTQVNLLTCQMKNAANEPEFDVVSFNRTYHFQAEAEADKDEWMSVLLNAKEGALTQAFNADNGNNDKVLSFCTVIWIQYLPL